MVERFCTAAYTDCPRSPIVPSSLISEKIRHTSSKRSPEQNTQQLSRTRPAVKHRGGGAPPCCAMSVGTVILIVFFLAGILHGRDKTDLMVMKNGDRMTCAIKGLNS